MTNNEFKNKHYTHTIINLGLFLSPDSQFNAYISNVDGGYVGTENDVKRLVELGIVAQKIKDKDFSCSIGFSEKEQKWYGWSHRASYGFGIGSNVKLGDVAFNPRNRDEFVTAAIEMYYEDFASVKFLRFCNKASDIIKMKGSIKDDNLYGEYAYIEGFELLLNDERVEFIELPDKYGAGEWTAKTLEDAKQMAIDYATNIA